MPLVVDASALLPLALQEDDQDYSMQVVAALANTEGHVSAIFHWEIWNTLWVNVNKRERTTIERAADFLVFLDDLKLIIDPAPRNPGVFGLCVDCDISAYDASYLHLAETLDCPLATLDKKLIEACCSRGVKVFQS